jgi:hypothetical protein
MCGGGGALKRERWRSACAAASSKQSTQRPLTTLSPPQTAQLALVSRRRTRVGGAFSTEGVTHDSSLRQDRDGAATAVGSGSGWRGGGA